MPSFWPPVSELGLRPFTLVTPKPLLPLKGRPILDWTLGALPATVDPRHCCGSLIWRSGRGVSAFTDVVHPWRTVKQEQPRGTGDAVRSCREFIQSDRVLVINGDDFLVRQTWQTWRTVRPGCLSMKWMSRGNSASPFSNRTGTLDKLVEKPDLAGRQLANTGAYLFPRAALDVELKLSARGGVRDYRLRFRACSTATGACGAAKVLAADGNGGSVEGGGGEGSSKGI